jgi:hypothetical protein
MHGLALHQTATAVRDAGRLPITRGVRLSQDDALRCAIVMRLMFGAGCVSTIWRAVFAEELAHLAPMAGDGHNACRCATSPRCSIAICDTQPFSAFRGPSEPQPIGVEQGFGFRDAYFLPRWLRMTATLGA